MVESTRELIMFEAVIIWVCQAFRQLICKRADNKPNSREIKLATNFFRTLPQGANWTDSLANLLANYRAEINIETTKNKLTQPK